MVRLVQFQVIPSKTTTDMTITDATGQTSMVVIDNTTETMMSVCGDTDVLSFDIETAPPMGDPYTGTYLVTPLPNASQELQTANKTLSRNVVIEEIPYYETHNEYGSTVYIGE